MDAFGQIAIVAAFVAVYAAVSARLEALAITGPIIFVAFGVIVGPSGTESVNLSIDNEVVEVLAELTLVIVLFTDAARIQVMGLRRGISSPSRLLGIAMPLSIGLGALVGVAVLGADWRIAALIAAILAPTDAALGQAVVTSPVVPARVRQTLNVESGLNDGLAVPFVTLFLASVAAEEGLGDPGFWARFALKEIGWGVLIGIAVGFGAGFLVKLASERGWTSSNLRPLSMLATAVLAWSLAEVVDGGGFIAAFVAGLVAGNITREACGDLFDFVEREGNLLTLLTFVVFGGAFVGPALGNIGWTFVLYAILSLTIVRMIPVSLAMLGSGVQQSTRLFLGWFGPRGLASIVLALGVIEELGALSDEVFLVVTTTVTISIVAHGLSARPLIRWYGAHVAMMVDADEEMVETGPAPNIRSRFGEMPMGPHDAAE